MKTVAFEIDKVEQDKLSRICEVIKKDTLEPAKQEAEKIIQNAKNEAKNIIDKAKFDALYIKNEANKTIENDKMSFQAFLNKSFEQVIDHLKEKIENNLFNSTLGSLIEEEMSKTEVVADILKVLIHAVQTEGLKADLTAIIPKSIDKDKVNQQLGHAMIQSLRGQDVELGDIKGGAILKLNNKKMSLEITEEVLKELINKFLIPKFRSYLFS